MPPGAPSARHRSGPRAVPAAIGRVTGRGEQRRARPRRCRRDRHRRRRPRRSRVPKPAVAPDGGRIARAPVARARLAAEQQVERAGARLPGRSPGAPTIRSSKPSRVEVAREEQVAVAPGAGRERGASRELLFAPAGEPAPALRRARRRGPPGRPDREVRPAVVVEVAAREPGAEVVAGARAARARRRRLGDDAPAGSPRRTSTTPLRRRRAAGRRAEHRDDQLLAAVAVEVVRRGRRRAASPRGAGVRGSSPRRGVGEPPTRRADGRDRRAERGASSRRARRAAAGAGDGGAAPARGGGRARSLASSSAVVAPALVRGRRRDVIAAARRQYGPELGDGDLLQRVPCLAGGLRAVRRRLGEQPLDPLADRGASRRSSASGGGGLWTWQ